MPSDEGIVVICEGEMDAITLHVRTGLVAWSSTAGANTVKPEFLAEFKENHTVFIVMDNDVSGQQGATKWKELLGEIAHIISLPAQFHDIGDYFAQGGTKETFKELLLEQSSLLFAEYVGLQAVNPPVRL
jgi:DNA primase